MWVVVYGAQIMAGDILYQSSCDSIIVAPIKQHELMM
jgi:hypothetical protein